MTRTMRAERTSGGAAKMRQLCSQKPLALSNRDATFQQESANLIDDAGALTDQSLAHPMQCLQIELLGGLRCHELHCGTLHRLSNGFRVTAVVLLSLRVRVYILRRHQPSVMTKCLQLPTQMMRTDASFHADQARRHVSQPGVDLATRPLLTQHDSTTIIKPNDVE